MEKNPPEARSGGIPTRTMEIIVALVFLALGGLVVYDSLRLGIRWAGDGPEAGYFPFYIGAIICLSALVTLFQAIFGQSAKRGDLFVAWGPLRRVLSVLIPAAQALGIDLVHFGVVVVVNIMLGLVTPPYGLLLFIMVRIANVPLRDIVHDVLPFLYVMILSLVVITFFPDVVLWLPRLVGYQG